MPTQTKAGLFSAVVSVSFIRIYSTPKCDTNVVRSAYEHAESIQEGAGPADPIEFNLVNEICGKDIVVVQRIPRPASWCHTATLLAYLDVHQLYRRPEVVMATIVPGSGADSD